MKLKIGDLIISKSDENIIAYYMGYDEKYISKKHYDGCYKFKHYQKNFMKDDGFMYLNEEYINKYWKINEK